MADLAPEFETKDQVGFTRQFSGSVGLAPIVLPSPSATKIEQVLVRMPSQLPNTKRLYWSIDNVVFHELSPGEFVGWELRKTIDGSDIYQIYLKGSVETVNYEVLINRAPV